jgi:adenylate cyclase
MPKPGIQDLFQRLSPRDLSIRNKLLFIISLIIVVSLSVVTYIAVSTFTNDAVTRVTESNKQTTAFLAAKFESDLQTMIRELQLIFSMQHLGGSKKLIQQRFFGEKAGSLYAGIFSGSLRSADTADTVLKTEFMNAAALKTVALDPKLIRNTVAGFKKEIAGAFQGKNISPVFHTPLLLILAPMIEADNTVQFIVSAVIRSEALVEAFKAKGITRSYLADLSGEIILHHDDKAMTDGMNLSKDNIWQEVVRRSAGSINGTFRGNNARNEAQLGGFRKIETADLIVVSEVSEDRALEAAGKVKVNSLLITLFILFLAVALIYIFAKTISDPISLLVAASDKIRGGNYHIVLESRNRDEIGHLTSAFSDMAKGLDEREKLKGALGKFVNPEIAERALKGELQLGGERKDATIFFSDIRSFTSISEKLEPEEVVEFLNEYMTLMVDCVNKTNGVVDKFIGDAIMAVWGTPVSRGNDPENCINAALMMRKALIKYNVGRGTDKKPRIMIGCGINSGPVLSGQIGSNERLEYTVIGDAVNLASRIESLNKPFRTDILISENTYERVKDLYYVHPMQKIKVKGKDEPQQIYAVLGAASDPDAPRTLKEMRTLVGIPVYDTDSDEANEELAGEESEVKYEILNHQTRRSDAASVGGAVPGVEQKRWRNLIAQSVRNGNLNSAASLALLSCDYYPGDSELKLLAARLCRRAGLHAQAIALGEKLRSAEPENVDNLVHLAITYARSGNLARGRTLLENALAIDSGHVKATQYLGELVRTTFGAAPV